MAATCDDDDRYHGLGRTQSDVPEGASEPERYAGAAVSWEVFPMLGLQPVLGRAFGPEDDRPGADPVVKLSDTVWRRRYSADPSAIGRSVLVN